jgi:hypothetical protein
MTAETPSPLPPMYAAWIAQLLGAHPPHETRATCDDCAMCNDVAPDASSYNPQTKCCTYLPVLPGFLVGKVLEDGHPEGAHGRATVRERIAAGAAVTPLGLGMPPRYDLLYAHGAERAFGQSVAMRCPHYLVEGGRCGIWRQRNSVCATWFCKHVRGNVGWKFWESVRELLSSIERDLARWCMHELDVGADAIAETLPGSPRPGAGASSLTAEELDGRRDDVRAAALWGSWVGREEEFYRACARLVDALDIEAVLRICGPEVGLRVEVVKEGWRRLTTFEPPERLRMGALVVLRKSKSGERVSTYSSLDPLEVPRALFGALHHFDGRRTNDEARRAIVEDGGPRISAGLVRKLADFGVLVPASEQAE